MYVYFYGNISFPTVLHHSTPKNCQTLPLHSQGCHDFAGLASTGAGSVFHPEKTWIYERILAANPMYIYIYDYVYVYIYIYILGADP